MSFTVVDEAGQEIEFACPETIASRWTSVAILEGRTYPHIPFTTGVRTVVDVGANCGATTVHLARHHPHARVHAVEPGQLARSYLERNVAALDNVTIHPVGLSDSDADATLFVPEEDLGKASTVGPPPDGGVVREPVSLRSAASWAQEQGLDAIDILKVDVEGGEVEVLTALAPLLPTVQVLYVEYDSRQARRAIDALVAPTHELYLAMLMALDQGECLYLRSDLADHPQAQERLREIFARVR